MVSDYCTVHSALSVGRHTQIEYIAVQDSDISENSYCIDKLVICKTKQNCGVIKRLENTSRTPFLDIKHLWTVFKIKKLRLNKI